MVRGPVFGNPTSFQPKIVTRTKKVGKHLRPLLLKHSLFIAGNWHRVDVLLWKTCFFNVNKIVCPVKYETTAIVEIIGTKGLGYVVKNWANVIKYKKWSVKEYPQLNYKFYFQ